MTKIQYTDSIQNKYYKLITNVSSKKIEKEYKKTWESELGYTLEEILCGDFDKLIEIKNVLSSKYKNDKRLSELFNYDKQTSTSTNFKPITSKLQPKISNFLEDKLEIHTCYFCNIDFINVFRSKTRGSKNGFTLDHLIDKACYPLFALSLYNLIPSCYICNSKLKGSKSLSYNDKDIVKVSPSSSQFKFDEKVKFKTFFAGINMHINSKNDFDVLLKEDSSSDYEKYIHIFMLDERYAYHKQHLLDMIKKRKFYPDSRIKELAMITNQTTQKVKQDLFGNLLYDNDLSKHSLSKFTKDIARELELI